MTVYLDTQKDLNRKIEKWSKQKGKLGRLIKECKSIVVKSRKLMKKVRKMIPFSKNMNLKMSQTMENFYQSQKEQSQLRDSDISESENHSETMSKKRRNITRSQKGERPSRKSEDLEWEESEKMYHSTRPDQNLNCLLYTSPSPRDLSTSRMPSSA